MSEIPLEIINKILMQREPHHIAKLIKYRFGSYYDGILTIYELNKIKENADKAKKILDNYSDKVFDEQREYRRKIRQQKELCGDECVRKLDEHLKICEGIDGTGKYKCTKDFISYDCKYKNNGRCSHYYEIEELESDLGDCNETIYDMRTKLYKLEETYNRELAKKENRIEEYDKEMEEEWDDYNFDIGQRMTY